MNDDNPHGPRILAVGGPTGIGKTGLGVTLAQQLNGEVVSADSVQLFKGFRIGAATPTLDERGGIRHHLIEVLDPSQDITAADFAQMADAAIADILARGKVPIVVGGSGLYLRALLYGLIDAPPRDDDVRAKLEATADRDGDEALWQQLHARDPHTADSLHPNDRLRVVRALEVHLLTGKSIRAWQEDHGFQQAKYHVAGIGLSATRSYIHRRINQRCAHMFEQGLIEEVRALLHQGVAPDAQAFRAIGYKEVLAYLQDASAAETGEHEPSQLQQDVATHTRRFARRQLVWFRKEPSFQWIDAQNIENILGDVLVACRQFLKTGRWQLGASDERVIGRL